jgi:hypothetical protein
LQAAAFAAARLAGLDFRPPSRPMAACDEDTILPGLMVIPYAKPLRMSRLPARIGQGLNKRQWPRKGSKSAKSRLQRSPKGEDRDGFHAKVAKVAKESGKLPP